MTTLASYPTLRKATLLLIHDSGIPPFLDEALLADIERLDRLASLPLAHAEAELERLTDDQLEEAVIGEEGAVPVSPQTHRVLDWLFEQC